MQKKPRVNKSKEEIAAQLAHKQKVDRQRVLARLIFPFIQDQKTIYDAQTVVNALAGYLKQDFETKTRAIVVKDLTVDLSKEEESPIKTAVLNLQGLLQAESADSAIEILQLVGNGLSQFASKKYMENPMNIIPVDEFVA